jgi:hypothetical protein
MLYKVVVGIKSFDVTGRRRCRVCLFDPTRVEEIELSRLEIKCRTGCERNKDCFSSDLCKGSPQVSCSPLSLAQLCFTLARLLICCICRLSFSP